MKHLVLYITFSLLYACSSTQLSRYPAEDASANCPTLIQNFFKTSSSQVDSKAVNLDWSNAPAEMELIRQQWNPKFFSDPKKHDPNKFMYIVRAITWKKDLETDLSLAKSMPNAKMLYASVINEKFAGTFNTMNSGYILKVPPENLLRSNPMDYNFAMIDDEYFETYGIKLNPNPRDQGRGLHSPSALVNATIEKKEGWNEVRLVGTTVAKTQSGQEKELKVEIEAIYYSSIDESTNLPLTSQELEYLSELAKQLNVPLLELPTI